MSLPINRSSFSNSNAALLVTNQNLISQLTHPNQHIRSQASVALSNRALSTPEIEEIIALTKSEYDNIIRMMAVQILGSASGGGADISKEIISGLVALLQDHNESLKIKDVAGDSLLNQADLSQDTIKVVMDSLMNGSEEDKLTLIIMSGRILSEIY